MARSRPFLVELHRGSRIVRSRRYSSLNTAVTRTVELAMVEGQPRDVAQLSHVDTGKELGFVKVSTNNQMQVHWEWEKEFNVGTPRSKEHA